MKLKGMGLTDEQVGRPPRGGRGLKFADCVAACKDIVSPPSRGAWIEIIVAALSMPRSEVAPLAGGVD